MAITPVAVGAKVTATTENLEIAAINAVGLTLVTPTSVTGAGSSLSGSSVVISAATVATVVNGCFTSTYTNYAIEFDMTYSSAGVPKIQLTLAGAAATAAAYDQQRISTVQATVTGDQDIAGTSWTVSPGNNTVAGRFVLTTKLYQPAVAVATYGYSTGFGAPNPMTAATTTATGTRGLEHRTATAYDGFTLLASGTVSGTIKVYGIL